MPTEKNDQAKRVLAEGSLRISCDDFHFRLRYGAGTAIADFPSLGMLARAAKIGNEIGALIGDLPPLPPGIAFPRRNLGESSSVKPIEFLVGVNSRPIGKLSFESHKPKFIPTPLRFFRKV